MVDRLESWKLNIMERKVASQLGQVKNLNLTGETQEKFETWKARWEGILTDELPDIEEKLFDAEQAADRYQFTKSKKILARGEQALTSIEDDIKIILQEVDELLDAEESSRVDIEDIQPRINFLRREISQNRYQFGKAESHFEKQIDEMEAMVEQYEELTMSGSYIQAAQLVNEMKTDMEVLEAQIKAFPDIYKQCKHELPSQLDELQAGIRSMEDEGYRVSHLALEKEIRTYQNQLLDGVRLLESGSTSEVGEMMMEIDERIKEMYELLEKEALAKNYLETKFSGYESSLGKLSDSFYDTTKEVEQLKQTYFFEDADMERYLSLEKTITKLKDQLDGIVEELENDDTAHTEIREQVEQGFTQIEELEERHEAFKKQIHNLRKDELEAKAKLSEMHEQLYGVKRKLKKSNIPGVPNFIWSMLETASDKNKRVIKSIENQPLDMSEVQQALGEAKKSVDQAVEQTDFILEQAYLTERVIQYANRYRSSNPILAAKLGESERLFRSYEYELALEQAAKAIEEVEPGALKRIESTQTVMAE
jgi:septation ring formation regulator